jgi:tRNA (guanine37-N1)-methyltransferase
MALRFDVITLFPQLFEPHLQLGITRRAFEAGQVAVQLWPLRDFASDAYRRVDDRPFGGGPGMVMLAEPLERAILAAQAARLSGVEAGPHGAGTPAEPAAVIHFSPGGEPLTQALVQELAAGPGAILLCGRYEGVDQRTIDRYVTREISLGDFVLSGGELPALALLDAVARLQPEVLTAASHQQDSFSDGLLEGPHYSRPEVLPDGRRVPAVLLGGHHAEIARWRRDQALARTSARRPDLIATARAAGCLSAADERFLAQLPPAGQLGDI